MLLLFYLDLPARLQALLAVVGSGPKPMLLVFVISSGKGALLPKLKKIQSERLQRSSFSTARVPPK